MKVKELINQLKQYDKDLDVSFLSKSHCPCGCGGIEYDAIVINCIVSKKIINGQKTNKIILRLVDV